jgi:NAD(P)-dependent dehydrogenase (short-subunit alcohol dehydrogenase family)
MEGFGEQSQLGRAGQPSEIAPTYVFLASAEAALYYGQILHPYPLGD